MTALSASASTEDSKGNPTYAYKVKNDEYIYKGGLVAMNTTTGYVESYAPYPYLLPCGVAQETIEGDTTATPVVSVIVTIDKPVIFKVAVTGASAITDMFKMVWASDDNTFTLTPNCNSPVAKIIQYHSATEFDIEIIIPEDFQEALEDQIMGRKLPQRARFSPPFVKEILGTQAAETTDINWDSTLDTAGTSSEEVIGGISITSDGATINTVTPLDTLLVSPTNARKWAVRFKAELALAALTSVSAFIGMASDGAGDLTTAADQFKFVYRQGTDTYWSLAYSVNGTDTLTVTTHAPVAEQVTEFFLCIDDDRIGYAFIRNATGNILYAGVTTALYATGAPYPTFSIDGAATPIHAELNMYEFEYSYDIV